MKIEIEGTDVVLEITKVTEVKTSKQMLHFDHIGRTNGIDNWRIIYNKDLIPDFTKVKGFKVIRD